MKKITTKSIKHILAGSKDNIPVVELFTKESWDAFGQLSNKVQKKLDIQKAKLKEFISNAEGLIADFSIKDSEVKNIIKLKRSIK